MLKKALLVTGYFLIYASLIGVIWSAPNYLGEQTGKLTYTFFLIFSALLQAAKAIGIGLLCLYFGKRSDH